MRISGHTIVLSQRVALGLVEILHSQNLVYRAKSEDLVVSHKVLSFASVDRS